MSKNFAPDPTRTVCDFQHFTEQEIADALAGLGINELTTKREKLTFARRELKPWIAELWKYSEDPYQPTHRQNGSRWLARRLESLDGLMAVIILAGTVVSR